jgi:hypothetical protein
LDGPLGFWWQFLEVVDPVFTLKVELKIFVEGDVMCERKREEKDEAKIFGLSKYKNEVNSILSQLTEMGKNVGVAGIEIIRSSDLKMIPPRCILDIQVEKQSIQLYI